jgi:hypothetical protein
MSDIAFWGGGWILVSTVLGVLLGKCIAVGMGTHPRAPDAEESTIAEAPLPEPSARLLAEVAVLTEALEKDQAPAKRRSERRKAS